MDKPRGFKSRNWVAGQLWGYAYELIILKSFFTKVSKIKQKSAFFCFSFFWQGIIIETTKCKIKKKKP